MILGVDTGGTFTDFILIDNEGIKTHKELSTPEAPEQAVLKGIRSLGLEPSSQADLKLIHGTTVATNAALENKGVKTAYVTNTGFADVLSIGRQTRPELYDLHPPFIPQPVPQEYCFEINCRRDYQGNIITPLNDNDIKILCEKINNSDVEAVAINLLYSYCNDEDEKRIAKQLKPSLFISCSHKILPVEKEYERGITTWLNSWLGPKVKHYLNTLEQQLKPWPLAIMQSSGGTITASMAGDSAVNLLLSGPAGGLAAAKALSRLKNIPRLLTFDMGGTSTDVALINKDIALSSTGRIGHYPVAVPMVDMITIGAGGGSIAHIDKGGLLQVGPESAGASPGPACYNQGGTNATVSDANIVLNRIPDNAKLAGNMPLNKAAAQQAIAELAQSLDTDNKTIAQGIITIANEHMSQALRRISIERGYDPQDFTLCCFGGAGGLHVCALADSLSMKRAIVPNYSGLLSALGMTVAPHKRQLIKSLLTTLDNISNNDIKSLVTSLATEGMQQLIKEGVSANNIETKAELNMRFLGQSHSLNIEYTDLTQTKNRFISDYQSRYGNTPKRPIELVSLQLAVSSKHQALKMPTIECKQDNTLQKTIFNRHAMQTHKIYKGPITITDNYATSYIEKGWQVEKDEYENLILNKLW